MKHPLLNEYLKNPCASSSLPYWKQKNLAVPENMKIVHDDDFDETLFAGFVDEQYFRLYHNLKDIRRTPCNAVEIVAATPDMIDEFVAIINASYSDLSVTSEQLKGYLDTPVYNPDLWILLKDKQTNVFVGGGIADYDRETRELIIEWIQVLPAYRRKGYGLIIVNALLSKMADTAKFATVSGKVDNPTRPEKLYRKCGFTGTDIWHILTKK